MTDLTTEEVVVLACAISNLLTILSLTNAKARKAATILIYLIRNFDTLVQVLEERKGTSKEQAKAMASSLRKGTRKAPLKWINPR